MQKFVLVSASAVGFWSGLINILYSKGLVKNWGQQAANVNVTVTFEPIMVKILRLS